MQIGILAIQGGYAAHASKLQALDVPYCYVKIPMALQPCDALIIPGGESTTLLKFMQQNGLMESITQMHARHRPIFGTCAGAILLAKEVMPTQQASLGLIDITVERNGYGRQLSSHIADEMVFIRAPKVCRVGDGVEVLASHRHDPVALKEAHVLVTTFHPELSCELTWHRYFVEMIRASL